ncbi:MAG: 2Fe-2S iron-sulfur cluster-binding protein [Oscillospiraceae bacterium]
MSKTIKETLLGTLVHGKEVLSDIEVARKIGSDKIYVGNEADDIISRLHEKSLSLKISEIRDATEGAKTLRFVSKSGYLPPFEAGQYINLFTEIDGVRTSRPYSISSSPRQRAYYEITVARIGNGFVSDFFLDKAHVGDEFEANGPAGVFHFNPVFHKKCSVFLAGGSGITPFMSMTREVLEAGLEREIYLLYGCRNADAAIFNDELLSLAERHENFHYSLVLSEPKGDWTGETGFIGAELIKKLVPNTNACTFYICGPQVMNEFCQKQLEAMEIPQKRIRREMFGSRQDIQNEPGWPKELTGSESFKLTVNGKTVPATSGESILSALERAGIRVNVCCRSGECSFCRVKLVSGKVFLAQGVLARAADEKFGYIHSCKAYPISDVEILL